MPVHLVPHAELPVPLNGYRLLERLGRGGFGEVWKVEAPGGLPKAAKFVFGDMDAVDDDESRPAEQEFKALNRVKLIRHPYILSLERFEAIEGQLIIIMELADRNLWDRFRECRGHAQPGIPRSELLRYMDETAEALDLMNRDHNIQHLDVKPQNIFLVHSHVKVADFGLAKMFEGAQATVTGGVTPVYAAPETFEGWISRFSDQYSLAIVFQELLTGTRPFNGANTKQLLMQHLNGAPDLSALGPADQAVIGRALSKKPGDRWPSCGEMVQALRECGPRTSTAGIPFPAPRLPGREDTPRPGAISPPPASSPTIGTARRAESLSEPVSRLVTPAARPAAATVGLGLVTPRMNAQSPAGPVIGLTAAPHPALTLPRPAVVQTGRMTGLGIAPPDKNGPGVLFPALVVAVGQTGLAVVRKLRQLIQERFGSTDALPNVRFLFVDTDPDTASAATKGAGGLTSKEVVIARLNRPAHYLQTSGLPPVEGWLPPGMLYRLPKQGGATDGVRAFGRLALCDNYQAVIHRVRREVEPFLTDGPLDQAGRDTGLGVRTNRPRAYVVAGLAGGTGSGMAIDLGFLLKHELKAVGYRKPDAVGVLLAPPPDGLGRSTGAANTYAALAELGHFAAGQPYQVRFDPAEPPVVATDGPFTRATLVPLPKKPRTKYQDAAYGLAARGLLVELATPAGKAVDVGRGPDPVTGPNGEPAVQLFGLHRLTWPRTELAAVATRRFAHHLLIQWAGKESAHLREPIDRWLTDEWAAKQLDGAAVLARLTAVSRDALGGNPEGVFAAAADSLRPTSWLAGRIDPQAAAGVFDQLLKLVGKPVGEMDQPTGLEAAIKEAAKGLTADAEAALSEITVKFIERPQYRLAGADEALAQVTARLTETADRLEAELAVLHRETVEAFGRLFQVIGGMAGRRTSADALDAFKVYPVAKLRHAVTTAALGVYRNLLGTVPDFVRDVTQCRGRLAEMAGQVAAGVEGSGDPGPATLLLPGGCETVEAAADQFLTALTPDDFLEFDQTIQQEVKRRFRGLASVCQKPARVSDFLALLTAEARAFLTDRLETTDPAAALYRHRGADAGQVLRAGYEAAGPNLEGVAGRPAEVVVLAVPPGPAGDRVAALAATACPGVSFAPARSTDDILIVRECPRVPLTALPQFGADAREAYQAQQATDFPPHARADVRWS